MSSITFIDFAILLNSTPLQSVQRIHLDWFSQCWDLVLQTESKSQDGWLKKRLGTL